MADRRIYAKTLTTSGLAFTAGGLLYGAVLSSRAGGASFTAYNVAHATTGHSSTQKTLVLYQSSATGSTVFTPALPVQMATGCHCSLSAKAVVNIFFSRKN